MCVWVALKAPRISWAAGEWAELFRVSIKITESQAAWGAAAALGAAQLPLLRDARPAAAASVSSFLPKTCYRPRPSPRLLLLLLLRASRALSSRLNFLPGDIR